MRNEFRFGYPGPVNDIGAHAAYVSVYNRALRIPHWVAEHLTRESIKRPADAPAATREESIFTEDANIPPQFRARLVDYTASGFDRGHMAPAADAKRSQQAMDETFLLTNIAPQVGPNFNRAIWADFENFTRDLTKYYDDVYVITGPLFMPHKDPVDGKFYVRYQVIGNPPNVAVPTHWYKAILVTSGPSENPSKMAVGAFIMPNAPIERTTPLKSFAVPLDLLEKSSGLTFFGKLANRYSLPFLCSVSSCDMKVLEFKQKAALK
ncbi:DNA/RNA non-specific endonuclease [Ramicandelaber brevisporus]|nr:DNA/RNA non-specific endonuclease [Ramicandelaber brevisporus]